MELKWHTINRFNTKEGNKGSEEQTWNKKTKSWHKAKYCNNYIKYDGLNTHQKQKMIRVDKKVRSNKTLRLKVKRWEKYIMQTVTVRGVFVLISDNTFGQEIPQR